MFPNRLFSPYTILATYFIEKNCLVFWNLQKWNKRVCFNLTKTFLEWKKVNCTNFYIDFIEQNISNLVVFSGRRTGLVAHRRSLLVPGIWGQKTASPQPQCYIYSSPKWTCYTFQRKATFWKDNFVWKSRFLHQMDHRNVGGRIWQRFEAAHRETRRFRMKRCIWSFLILYNFAIAK